MMIGRDLDERQRWKPRWGERRSECGDEGSEGWRRRKKRMLKWKRW